MPRKKKKEKINIKSSETQIFFGLVLFVLGVALILTPFVKEQADIFVFISTLLGWPAMVWGIAVTAMSINLLTQGKSFSKVSQILGFVVLAFSLNTLLTFWVPVDSLEDISTLQRAGGTVGQFLHVGLNDAIGDVLELIVLLIVLIVAFSFITGIELKQITEVIRQLFTKISLKDLQDKIGTGVGDEKMVISGMDDDNELTGRDINQQDDDIQIQENMSHQKEENLFSQNVRENNSQQPLIKNQSTGTTDIGPATPKYTEWVYPSIDNLQEPKKTEQPKEAYKEEARVIETVLRSFNIPAKVVEITIGPTVVRYALSIPAGVAVNRVKRQSNDIEVALRVTKGMMRIEAPIPGTSYIGIEIPNKSPNYVHMKEMARKLLSEADKYQLPLILGRDIAGKPEIRDLVNLPHLLVAGMTRSGKSVGINSILGGLLLTKTPDELKLVLVDPKMVELEAYNGIPHLLTPVINDMELVVNAMQWSIEEMMKRYRQLKQVLAKNIVEYNLKMGYNAMPYLVIVIDEMADLMLVAGPDIETKIQRLAQMGRAVGVHLILATQKPVVTVITGLIRSNISGRIAYSVPTAMDSRVILDQTGAENLLGNGDMLYKDQTMSKPIRIQGCFISTEDSIDIINQLKAQVREDSEEEQLDISQVANNKGELGGGVGDERDPEFEKALNVVISEEKASASLLQRRLNIGYNKAARLMEQLEKAGAIGRQDGVKPRGVLVSSASEILGSSDQDMPEDF
ncbi:MAG: FtsK/SpoIIIE family protein [candidate division WS6 bacterium GW2011_GWE1_34_7]|uniref:FtsK/SpoIIIE family protein n=1 Tax=candidate division WS6 bacterium GW2011_GWE1_34_7 TaxID=1619093 RepID=A0A0G0B9B8_9BACT|nr:MAG: FtsK/SpoIIIE family protein [candidate division WS6 bacterium GW2011_GWE1_34_7]